MSPHDTWGQPGEQSIGHGGQLPPTTPLSPPMEGGQYRRQDVISAVEATVGRGKIIGLGQLESNLRWKVVFKDTASKQTFMNGQISVKGVEATTENMQRKPHPCSVSQCVFQICTLRAS